MNSSNAIQTLPQVDMHIGPVFDVEKYLDLERVLFKTEPRAVPRPRQSPTRLPAQKSWFGSFIQATTKFACKLEDALRAPFKVFSSKQKPSAERGERENVDATIKNVKVQPRRDISPPLRASPCEDIKSTHHPGHQTGENALVDKVTIPNEDGKVHEANEKSPVVRKGYVMGLIKFYEDFSDLTSEGSAKGPKKGLVPNTQQEEIESPSPLADQQVINPEVKKATKENVGSSSITRQRAVCSAKKSGRRVRFCEEDKVLYAGCPSNRRGNKGRTSDNALNGRSEPKTVWFRFCGLQRGGNHRS